MLNKTQSWATQAPAFLFKGLLCILLAYKAIPIKLHQMVNAFDEVRSLIKTTVVLDVCVLALYLIICQLFTLLSTI